YLAAWQAFRPPADASSAGAEACGAALRAGHRSAHRPHPVALRGARYRSDDRCWRWPRAFMLAGVTSLGVSGGASMPVRKFPWSSLPLLGLALIALFALLARATATTASAGTAPGGTTVATAGGLVRGTSSGTESGAA